MDAFDFQPRTRIIFGANQLDHLGDYVSQLKAKRILLVTDPGILKAGHIGRATNALANPSLEWEIFDGVEENPSTATVQQALEVANEFRPDLLIGIGGGSSMDCAKGLNFIYTNGGKMQDYWGKDKATKPMLPMIAIPTTAGTGSETQSFALISDEETHVKMACGDKKAACVMALLDPALTLTQPSTVTSVTGIDAISHALETYVTKPRNAVSLMYSRQAWKYLHASFPKILAEPLHLEARGTMLLGASWAGMAIENSMLGAAHACANPLTARFNIIHGQAIALTLPGVIRFNGEDPKINGWYEELLEVSEIPFDEKNEIAAEVLANWVTEQAHSAKLFTKLRDCSIPLDVLDQLSEDAAKQWTGTFNPRPVKKDDFQTIYESIY
ncbi:Iron-containing alcohol dehydrogenase [Planctomycetales bacterium 10988]|nr:Iron-containing alcohol dehydrogenase [Planctomycetales bacterium 10988]